MSTSEHDWFKSTYSSAQGDNCIEVAVTATAVHVRDSKDLARRPFVVDREQWVRFLAHAAGR
ncbi:DUF397 domain-containing protein [Streptomyces sp. TR02-1]|uniref:DUF397 domain-containing protein n=1 Tax=Streptomyces sp. TR02-1 TaxID=3385977 RepID=UPI00399FC2E5